MPASRHSLTVFEEDLRDLTGHVSTMGTKVASMLERSMEALLDGKAELAAQVRKDDKTIDRFQHEVEDKAIVIIAKRQPMAIDLREVVASMRIAGELERIADLAKNGAKRVGSFETCHLLPQVRDHLRAMGILCREQLMAVMKSYASKDAEMAQTVWSRDGEVDLLYNGIFLALHEQMVSETAAIGAGTHLLFIAKNLERVGDHATNIAESVYYLATGSQLGDDRPKNDRTSYVSFDKP